MALILASCDSSDDETGGISGTAATPPAADLVALGEELFQRTAGGIGCQACHGSDALGDFGPNILGKSAETIKVQLDTNENMTFIILTDEEIEAIAAYLAVLQANADAQMDG